MPLQTMNVLPVIDREMQRRSRQGRTYWLRAAAAGLGAAAAAQEMLFSSNPFSPTLIGYATFRAVAWIGFLLAFCAIAVTADELSKEKREGTLGLLLLTKLSGFDVVLGKAWAGALTAGYTLIGLLPALAVVMLAGGVSGSQVFRVSIALVTSVLLFLAIGMWVSARSHKRGKALAAGLILGLAVCAGPVVLSDTFRNAWLGLPSPLSLYHLASDPTAASAALFWGSVGAVSLVTLLLLLWTGFYLWRHTEALEAPPKPIAPAWVPSDPQNAEALAAASRDLLNDDPVCWIVSRMRIQTALFFGTMMLLMGGTGLTWAALMSNSGGAAMLLDSMHFFVTLIAAALLAWAAGRYLSQATRTGELELLLTTPQGAKEIVAGNWRALCKPLRGAWLLLGFLVLFRLLSGTVGRVSFYHTFATPISQALDVVALCWLGMYFGSKGRATAWSIGWCVSLVVAMPWLVSFVFTILLLMANSNPTQTHSFMGYWEFGWLWPFLNIIKDVWLIVWASSRLGKDLRAQAAALRPRDWLE